MRSEQRWTLLHSLGINSSLCTWNTEHGPFLLVLLSHTIINEEIKIRSVYLWDESNLYQKLFREQLREKETH